MLTNRILEKLPLEFQVKWQLKQRKDASLNLIDLFDFTDESSKNNKMVYAFSRKAKMDAKTNVSTCGELSSGKKPSGGCLSCPPLASELAAVLGQAEAPRKT